MARSVDTRQLDPLKCDLLVVGGGAAGLAAATVAARNGLQVILIERYGFCGGGAVAGLSGTVCGYYEATDNRRNRPVQAVWGFAEEFVTAMEARGGLTDPVQYGKTYTRVHDPLIWRELADDFLFGERVTVIFHAVAVEVLMEGGERVAGAKVWTKEGPLEVQAKVTVDASGDADLVAMAGFPSMVGDDGRVQNPTMIFRINGVDVGAFDARYGPDTIMPVEVSEMIQAANASGRYILPRAKIWLFQTTRPDQLLCNCTRIIGEDGRELNALYHKDFTEAEKVGRKQTREYARFFRENLAGCGASWMDDTAVQVGIRQTRQVGGRQTLSNRDVTSGRKRNDGIARSPWPIELHAGSKPKVEWLLDDVYEVPYECFVPSRGVDLLAVGRCLSAEHEAVASARVTAQCFGYGHAIGHAAVMSIRDRIAPHEIRGADLRHVLNADGARLD